MKKFLLFSVLGTAFILGGCSTQGAMNTDEQLSNGNNAMPDHQGMNDVAMQAMDHDMSMTMGDMVKMLEGKTGDDLDRAFLEGMIPHHQGAIDMANMMLESARHEELKQMAREIIAAQQREIDMMRQWQKDWGYIE